MSYSNSHSYPLSFPNDAQLAQISAYSSLANALSIDPGHAGGQGSLRTKRDEVTVTPTIYANKPPVNNPLYPYPACNVLNPWTYPASTPVLMTKGRCPASGSNVCNERSDQKGLPWSLPSYERLPQPVFGERGKRFGNQAEIESSTICFLRKGNERPYSIRELLEMSTMPELVAGDLPILVQSPDRWIKIKLIWPGYSRYPFEKRIPIRQGALLTPPLLLTTLAYHVYDFVRWIQSENAIVEPGQEHWDITGVPESARLMWKECVITSLQHRTGCTWQLEIYYLRR